LAGGAGASSTFGAAGAAAAGVAAVAQPALVAQPPQEVVVAQPPHAGLDAQHGFASQLGLASQQDSCLQHFTLAGLHFSTLHFTGLHLTGLQQFFASAVLASNIAANATIRPRCRMISTLHSLSGTCEPVCSALENKPFPQFFKDRRVRTGHLMKQGALPAIEPYLQAI